MELVSRQAKSAHWPLPDSATNWINEKQTGVANGDTGLFSSAKQAGRRRSLIDSGNTMPPHSIPGPSREKDFYTELGMHHTFLNIRGAAILHYCCPG